MRCLRSIARIKRRDKVPNTDVLWICDITGIEAMLLQAQLRWVGHVVRMPDIRIPKQVFYGELEAGVCRVVQWRGTRITWRPILKHVASPHEISIPLHCRGIPGGLAVKLLSRALKQTELTRYVTNVQIGKQLQQRRRACGPVISAVARAPPGSVSTPSEKHIDDGDP